MINTKEIKKLLIDKSMTINDIAKYIGKSYSNTNRKLNGITQITLSEAEKIQFLLGITDCDFGFYFFSHNGGDRNDYSPHA
jgi:transcriptional regulator with XRE-family HTH domain